MSARYPIWSTIVVVTVFDSFRGAVLFVGTNWAQLKRTWEAFFMIKNEFEIGEEVQHKTGKAKMIYLGVDATGDAICEWTDPSGHPQRASFAHAALKKYERPADATIRVGRV
jgi:uncharacterized protein YodC (DUF2158 family)